VRWREAVAAVLVGSTTLRVSAACGGVRTLVPLVCFFPDRQQGGEEGDWRRLGGN
jgi:hypothetical protein